jgi:hypothetical protein
MEEGAILAPVLERHRDLVFGQEFERLLQPGQSAAALVSNLIYGRLDDKSGTPTHRSLICLLWV